MNLGLKELILIYIYKLVYYFQCQQNQQNSINQSTFQCTTSVVTTKTRRDRPQGKPAEYKCDTTEWQGGERGEDM